MQEGKTQNIFRNSVFKDVKFEEMGRKWEKEEERKRDGFHVFGTTLIQHIQTKEPFRSRPEINQTY